MRTTTPGGAKADRIWPCLLAIILLWMASYTAQSDELWSKPGVDGRMQVQLYFFWSATCPHCLEARPL